MFDQTDLNLRYRAHDDRIARGTASDAYTPERAARLFRWAQGSSKDPRDGVLRTSGSHGILTLSSPDMLNR